MVGKAQTNYYLLPIATKHQHGVVLGLADAGEDEQRIWTRTRLEKLLKKPNAGRTWRWRWRWVEKDPEWRAQKEEPNVVEDDEVRLLKDARY